MNLLRVFPTGNVWPYSFAQLRKDEPQLSISDAPHPGEIASWLDLSPQIIIIVPEPTAPPEYDPTSFRAVEVHPETINNKWTQSWTLEPLPPTPPSPQWSAFAEALEASPLVVSLYNSAPNLLCHKLTGSLLRAMEGHPEAFSSAWLQARQLGLLSPELAAEVLSLSETCNLPLEFISSLQPRRARNPDGTFRADDPATPDVNEAWEN